MRKTCLIILVFLAFTGNTIGQVLKTKTPDWVKSITFSKDKILKEDGGYQILLVDFQDNLINESVYEHKVFKALNSSGVQTISTITATFDPSYQQLEFHSLQIIRDGTTINKLMNTEIETYQRETSMERHLYDGTLTASINLTDVRQNDIIEYSFTIKGFNPINKGNYSSTFYLQSSIPISRVFYRIIASSPAKIRYQLFNKAPEPIITKSNNQVEYLWDKDALDFLICDNNIPEWFNPYRRVKLSTFNDWKTVVNWAIPLYAYDKNEIDQISKSLQNGNSEETKILELIRMVQDEIRYLGFESGINAYKPNSPLNVLNQKFGDCKDKSLLLVALLQHEGFVAYPMLVNTWQMEEIKNVLPDNDAFNHCITYLEYDGYEYFIDPTSSEQGGDLDNLSFPDYKFGLLIKPGQDHLIEIPDGKKRTIEVNETIFIDTIGGDARLNITTKYSGANSDYIRNYFKAYSSDKIQMDYLNYYSSLHPKIFIIDEIKFDDSFRNSTNITTIEENYLVKDFWQNDEKTNGIYCELYPLDLESRVTYPQSAKRSMPYLLSTPFSFVQSIEVVLPEIWSIEETNKEISGDGFQYKETVVGKGKKVLLNYYYDVNKSFIPVEAVGFFLNTHEEIRKNLTYSLSYNNESQAFKLSWLTILLILSVVGLGTFLAHKLYYHFDPPGNELAANIPIGGWLILPAIGLIASPFMLLYNLGIWDVVFDRQYWINLQNLTNDKSLAIVIFVSAEIASNLLLIIFDVVVAVLFFKRRTSVPGLISILYLVGIFLPVIDLVLYEMLFPEIFSSPESNESLAIARGVVFGIIWITYFNVSQRVRDTFCIRINSINKEVENQDDFPVVVTKTDQIESS